MGITEKTETQSLTETESGKESGGKGEASGRLFTQSEVDKLIGERLKRERSLNAGLSEMKEVITQLQNCGILNASSRAGAASELAGRLQAMLAGNGKPTTAENDAENAGGVRDGEPEKDAGAKTEADRERTVFCAEKTGLSETSEDSEKPEDSAGSEGSEASAEAGASGNSEDCDEKEVGGASALSRNAEEKSDAEDGGKKTDSMPYGGFFDAKSRAGAMGLFASGASGACGASEIGEISEDGGASPFGLRREELCGLYAESMAEAKEAEKPEEAAEPDGDDTALLTDAEGLRALLLSAARGMAASGRGSEETLNGALKEMRDEASDEVSDGVSDEIPKEIPKEIMGEGAYPEGFVSGEKSVLSAKEAGDELSELCERFPDADPGKIFADKGFCAYARREAERGKSLASLYGEYTELLQSIAALRTGTGISSEVGADGDENGRHGGRHSGLFSTGFSGKGASASAYLADSLTASQREIARLAGLSLREYAEMLRDIPGKEVMGRER